MGIAQCFAYSRGQTDTIPIRNGRYLSKQTITTGVAAVQSVAMPSNTAYVIIEADTVCHFKVDDVAAAPLATTTDPTIRVDVNGEFNIGAGEYFSLIE